MAFDETTRSAVDTYARKHIASDDWFDSQFDYVTDTKLRTRLVAEFKSARYIYKVLEGLAAKGWLQAAQVKLQVLWYASIYEAVLHHILFDRCTNAPEVVNLMKTTTYKRISVSKELNALVHDGKKVLTMYATDATKDITKIRFDEKVNAAVSLGLIAPELGDDLIGIYEARNAIHLHAEIRKRLTYTMSLSELAYRRMRPFCDQLRQNTARLGI